MTEKTYIAVLERGDTGDIGVHFPDLPGCVSAGDTVQQALDNAREALSGHLALMLADGDALPTPRSLTAIQPDPECPEIGRFKISAPMPDAAGIAAQ